MRGEPVKPTQSRWLLWALNVAPHSRLSTRWFVGAFKIPAYEYSN